MKIQSNLKSQILKRFLTGVLAGVVALPSASALTIRHDRSTRLYEDFGRFSRFDGSCVISRRNNPDIGIASSTCFDDNWVILARHTLRNVENYTRNNNDLAQIRPRNWQSGLARHQSNDRRVRVDQITYFDDDFSSFTSAIDIAVAASRFNIQPIRRAVLHSRWDEQGRVCDAASGANNRTDGNGNSRKTENRNTTRSPDPNNVRWGGQNRVDRLSARVNAGARILEYDFDGSRGSDPNRYGSATPMNRENATAGGDSGSPIYVANGSTPNSIAGVLSGGVGGGRYGASAVYPRVRFYRTWVFDTLRDSQY